MVDFLLPNEDREYLTVTFHNKWDKCVEGSKKGIIISGYQLPRGYEPKKSDLMIIIPDNYPVAKIDMFYFSPFIQREDGKVIGALENETHFGKDWQRWSRHYDWRDGIDNIATHISYITNELKSELNKR